MADAFAVDNVSVVNSGAANIIDIVGCDGPPFGHVTVEYEMQQGLFFAGVLGFDGPAAVRTAATAGWGPAGGANPLPIVVYTGNDQGSCDIEEDTPPGVDCYLWFDNDLFNGSSFGFLNLCTDDRSVHAGMGRRRGGQLPERRGQPARRLDQRQLDGRTERRELSGPHVRVPGERSLVVELERSRTTDRGRSDLPRERLHDAGRQQREPGDLLPEPAARQVQHHRLHRAAPR